MASGLGNCNNENESTSAITSVQQSGRPLVLTDNPLSVGLVGNDTATMTQEPPRSVMDLQRTQKHFKVKAPDKVPTRIQNVCIFSVKCVD